MDRPAPDRTLDTSGTFCPVPIIETAKLVKAMGPSQVMLVIATDPGSVLDFQGWVKASSSYELVKQEEGQDEQGRKTFVHLVRKKA